MAKIGDLIPKAGIYTNPGVVTERKEDGSVVIDTDPMAINKYHRYSNTTGLSEKEKLKFNHILDEIYTNDDDVKKIELMQQSIDDLKVDPANTNIVQYLRNQQSHLIRKTQSLPRMYRADSTTLRV